MKRWLHEPLLHFLVLGALIFAGYRWLAPDQPGTDEIVVTRGQQEHLVTAFTRTWQRPPTEAEFSNLVDDWVREEIAYREAKQMGLDANDTIIRRRLRQKLETLADDIVSMAEPTDQDLQRYLQENAEQYRSETRYSLQQIYFSTDRRGDQAGADAGQVLALLNNADASVDTTALGDPIPLPQDLDNERESAIAAQFGQLFVEGLQRLEEGQWAGPVRSGYGLHLVRIESMSPGRALALAEVRDEVLRDWSSEQRDAAMEQLYERLAERYTLSVEPMAEPAAAE